MKLDLFKQSGIHKIILLLLEKEMKITEISLKVHSQAAYRSIKILQELKLIDFERREWNTKYYFLTAKGKKVASKLKEIEAILQED